MSDVVEAQVSRNRAMLESIIKAIIVCGKRNVPLRGKTQESSNLMALLSYRAEADEALQAHLNDAPKNAKYLSPQIQNEFIEICGDMIRNTIISSQVVLRSC